MYTLVSTHMTPIEAHIFKGRIEAEGLIAVVLFEHHIWAKWSLSHALGGVRVLVPHAMANAANQVIQKINSGEYEKLLIKEQGITIMSCPKCGSNKTGAHVWLWKLSLAFLFTISIPMPYTSHLYSCDDCKYSWIAHNQRPYPLFTIAFFIAFIGYLYYLLFMFSSYVFEWNVLWK
jgi:hypothetical protein